MTSTISISLHTRFSSGVKKGSQCNTAGAISKYHYFKRTPYLQKGDGCVHDVKCFAEMLLQVGVSYT